MHGPTLEQMDAERELMVARRRVDRYAPDTPEWVAAVEAVRAWEARIRFSNPPGTSSGHSIPRYR